jgi:hypothetical protein
MKRNWPIFVFFILIIILIFYFSVVNQNQKANKPLKFAPVSFLDSYYTENRSLSNNISRKLVQEPNLNDPAVKQNLEIINKANALEQKKKLLGANTICVFKANKFLPYTFDQFVNTFTGLILPQQLLAVRAANGTRAANGSNNYQLVDFSKIKPVDADKAVFYGIAPKLFNQARDQGACGSCWAYSAVTAVEAQVVKKFLIENPAYVSTQYYIDCVEQCKGCKGGFPIFVYEQVAKDGFVVWDDYAPYLGKESGTCAPPRQRFPYQLQGSIVFSKDNAAYFTKDKLNDAFQFQNLELSVPEPAMIEKIKQILFNYGPISVLIYVDDKLPFFSSGIYKTVDTKDGVKQKPNHAVVIGGYGINVYGESYWIMRNSWGESYGEAGNIPLSMDSPICGLDIPVFDEVPPVIS